MKNLVLMFKNPRIVILFLLVAITFVCISIDSDCWQWILISKAPLPILFMIISKLVHRWMKEGKIPELSEMAREE